MPCSISVHNVLCKNETLIFASGGGFIIFCKKSARTGGTVMIYTPYLSFEMSATDARTDP